MGLDVSSFSADAAAPNIPDTRLASVSCLAIAVRTTCPLRITVTTSAEVQDLIEEMTDVDDRRPVRPQTADQRVQLLGLDRGQRRRRLVQHDHARVGVHRAQDLDLLLICGAQ